jgi:hypothetical protein
MNRVFNDTQKQFIREFYPEHGSAYVAMHLNMKQSQIRTFVHNNKINRTNDKHAWTPAELDHIATSFPHRRTNIIASEMGLSYIQVCNMSHKLNIKKTEAFLKSPECNRLDGKRGSATRFVKGHATHNKGVTMSAELREKVRHTWFQKGNEPHNTKFDGYERITKDGYREIRVNKGKFVLLHRHNWEKVNGPIAPGIIMRCKDGDILNCDPDNWFLIDRVSQLGQNSGRDELEDRYIISKLTHRHPELKPAIAEMPELIELKRSQIKLKRTINELTETSANDR